MCSHIRPGLVPQHVIHGFLSFKLLGYPQSLPENHEEATPSTGLFPPEHFLVGRHERRQGRR